jgi:hypothetical protein
MSVQLKIREVEYWSCGKDRKGHWHKSEIIADLCLKKQQGMFCVVNYNSALMVRNYRIMDDWTTGKTITELSVSNKLSQRTINNILVYFIEFVEYSFGNKKSYQIYREHYEPKKWLVMAQFNFERLHAFLLKIEEEEEDSYLYNKQLYFINRKNEIMENWLHQKEINRIKKEMREKLGDIYHDGINMME